MKMVIVDPEDFVEMAAIGWILSVLAMLVVEMEIADLL